MAGKILFAITAIALILLIHRWWINPQRTRQKRWQVVTLLFLAAVLLLTVSGKLHPLFAALATLIPLLNKVVIQLLRYWPLLSKLTKDTRSSGTGYQQQNSSRGHSETMTHTMSKYEALEVLGLTERATREDIVNAHRRLIQKVHPDRGGSDYLATRINLAKEVLLKNSH